MFQEKATFRIWQKNSFPMQHKEAAFDKNDPITSGSFKQLLCFEELSSAVGVYNSTCKECLISWEFLPWASMECNKLYNGMKLHTN